MNAQTAAHKRGAREITPADLQVAVDAGSEFLPRYGYRIPTYSADASRLVKDAVDSAGGRLNAAAIEHLRRALASGEDVAGGADDRPLMSTGNGGPATRGIFALRSRIGSL